MEPQSSEQKLSLPFDPAALPLAQLESIKFKLIQAQEAIRALQAMINAEGQPFMLAWPEILTKFNLILSHIHTTFNSLSPSGQIGGRPMRNPLPNLVLHPPIPIAEGAADFSLSSLLRMMRLPDVLAADEATVAHLSTALKPLVDVNPTDATGFAALAREVEKIRVEHDAKVDRAVKAVKMLKDGRKKRLEEKRRHMEAGGSLKQTVADDDTSSSEESLEETTADVVMATADSKTGTTSVAQSQGGSSAVGENDDDDDDDLESVFGGKVDTADSPDGIDQENVEMALVEDLPPDEPL